MFDAGMIGRYISFMRKKRNLTQGRLAEELGVSHQAVSNWERGEAMPDISLLQSIARILETTTDRILAAGEIDDDDEEQVLSEQQIITPGRTSQNGDLDISVIEVENYINGDDRKMDINHETGSKNAEIDSGCNNSQDSEEDNTNNQQQTDTMICSEADWKKVCKLAPFASSETLDKFIGMITARDVGTETSKRFLKYIKRLAPFLNNDSLDLLTRHMKDKADWDGIVSLAPYLHEESLSNLVENADLTVDFSKILQLAPFLNSEALDSLAERIDVKTSYDKIVELAPFLDSKTVDKLIMDTVKNL